MQQTIDRAGDLAGGARLISIVIPSYNHAQYIEACLDSVYFQDYLNLEIIIVDDCSQDGSGEVIEKWLEGVGTHTASYLSNYNEETGELVRTTHKRYDRQRSISFLRNEKNLGSTRTYNRGFREATGEYCSFVVSDDICHPQMLSTLAKPLDEDRADFVYSDMFIIDDAYRVLKEFRLPDYDFEKSFCNWYLCGVATLYRRSLHLDFGYYDETAMADDHECYLRFAMNGARFLHIPRILYSVRSHENRQEGLHSTTRFNALLDHSKSLVQKARRWRKENS
ncbi:glycosyltransferase [Pseudodesulfovibrio sp. F-1]|uniref:Glycosyltransferase n=1 Tax=Pseudodesulfovibrio alkaliphilus TaxID=2661613 RepID=A0A7K1KN70_9BACT|nr:glycosyltransferase [Pseudodesulfovibrio alkaliphilus]MUM77523.1 glycosyltransferase [Pseudodesulfovibrio alkaliphilus]